MFSVGVSEDLRMELLDDRHAISLFHLIENSREHLSLWMPWAPATRTVSDVSSFISRAKQDWAKGKGLRTVLLWQGQEAGILGLNEIDRAVGTANVGYWLGTDWQGRGIMTQACRKLCELAFSDLDLNCLRIYCGTENHGSRAVAQRLGFQQDGIVRACERIGDRILDHYVFSLLAREWKEGREGSI